MRGPLVEEIAQLKAQQGGEIVVTGSITVVHALNQSKLVDEYRLFMYPAVVGEGRRLFQGSLALPNLELVEAHPFSSGVVLLRYRTS